MIYLRAIFLFSLVALHLIGGAALFRRLFPRESPWLGFIIPCLTIALVCNCLEHAIALTWLACLLPFTAMGSVWLLISRKTNWRLLWKPTVVFLLCFAIPFVLRCLKPNLGLVRDGPLDLSLIGNFCMGDTLPPENIFMPGFRVTEYYDFTHYAASVAIRLFDLDLGTGFNVMSALLAGLILFCTGAIAYRLSQRRLWISLIVVLMTAAAMDGITDDLWLRHPDFKWPDDATNLFNRSGVNAPGIAVAPYDSILPRRHDYYATHELIPPGYWTWIGSYHSVMAGQFLVLFTVFCLVEMFNRRRTNWPWIGPLWAMLLLLVCSTWAVPITATFFLISAIWCLRRGIHPRDWRIVARVTAAALICLTPMLIYFLRVGMPYAFMPPEGPTPLYEFLLQWWPVYIPWALLLFWWPRTHPVVRILQILLPVFFLALEHFNLEARIDTTGKLWGVLFAAGWAAFLPTMLALRSWTLRAVFALFFAATVISTCFWVDFYYRSIWWPNVAQLTGEGDFRTDPAKGRVLNIVNSVHHKIIIPGRSTFGYDDDPILASLTYNRAYIAWYFHTKLALEPDSVDEADARDADVNNLLNGKLPNPLDFLLTKSIWMVVIWPDQAIAPAVVEALKPQLAPAYTYIDCRGLNPDPKAPQAGVFLYRDPADKDRLLPTQNMGQ
jgi:hypothetical protein